VFHADLPSWIAVAAFAAAGIVLGLVLLVRGFNGYLSAGRIRGTSPSRIRSIAVGEVLVTGAVEPAEVLLVSPLQSAECVYYRSRISDASEGDPQDLFREERAVGFRVRDPSGSVRVFPRGAGFDVPDRFDEVADASIGPAGYLPRVGPVYAPGPDDREARIAQLLTIRRPGGSSLLGRNGLPLAGGGGRRHYREARIEPGDVVTVVGRVLPFSEVADPAEANVVEGTGLAADDPEILGDIAEARAAGLLEATPEEAWGNAAIPGFGIGRPVRPPELDPDADPLPLATAEAAARAEATFDIRPETLVLGTTDDAPLRISLGAPAMAAARADWQFLTGLVGALLAIGSAVGLALLLNRSVP
jgi:hypothetical protein